MKFKTVGYGIGIILLILVVGLVGYYAGTGFSNATTVKETLVQTVYQTTTQPATTLVQTVTAPPVTTTQEKQITTTTTITQPPETTTTTIPGTPTTQTVTTTQTTTLTSTLSTTLTAHPITRKSDLIIRGVTQGMDALGWYAVRGEVFNNGTGVAKFVEIYVTFYDLNKNVLATGSIFTTPSDIYAGEAAPFEASCMDKAVIPNITSYKLVVDMMG